jgi:hypothetical protein
MGELIEIDYNWAFSKRKSDCLESEIERLPFKTLLESIDIYIRFYSFEAYTKFFVKLILCIGQIPFSFIASICSLVP